MIQQKIVIDIAAREDAHRVAGLLQELMQPTPDALTLFENTDCEDGNKAWRIAAYFQDITDTDLLLRQAAACLGTPALVLSLEAVPEKNWVALSQAALPPVRAGRFTIYGSHDRHRIARGPSAILIDAGEAFGTAHHATTYGCLVALDRLTRLKSISTALDLGCGSAVLSIALARAAPRAKIIATDLDAQSVKVAAHNIALNGARHQVTTLCADGLQHPKLRQRCPFDLVVANILAGPLIGLAPDIRTAVKPGGSLILSGVLQHKSPEVQAHYCAQGFRVCTKIDLIGWTTLVLTRAHHRPSDIKAEHI